ncbi:helix-turn-helix domain-containing protein [Hwangdonia sp.]|uniref:helix-turn-helix domain-containing protein n=1 Tax=Hwangdonia sp. TaxID=1883432 RepID=UPI003AB5218C
MNTIKSSGVDCFEDLNHLSQHLGEKICKEEGFCSTQLNPSYGEGLITATKLSSEISVFIFDIVLKQDLELLFKKAPLRSIDFIFCLEGSAYHKFNALGYEQINFRQNFIVSRNKKSSSTIKFGAHTPIKMTLISYKPDFNKIGSQDDLGLRKIAFRILSDAFLKEEDYRYSGRICFRTSKFVSDILKYSFNSSSDLLFKEAAIINTMASQIDRHDKGISGKHKDAPIRQFEIDQILATVNFISNNLSENLSVSRLQKISGLSSDKLQKGFKYLFNKSVNVYITEKRLEKAAQLIYETDFNVSELVYSVGFSSRSYFSKIFKRYFGVLPSQCVTNPQLINKVIAS